MDGKIGAGESDLRTSSSYEVGWGKPPAGSMFTPGTSGNPRGRPPGSRNKQPLEQSLLRIAKKVGYTKTSVNVAGKVATLTTAEAVLKLMVADAAKGNTRAGRDFLAILERAERGEQAKQERMKAVQKAEFQELLSALRKYVKACTKRLAKCRSKGLPRPVFFPNPDHIDIDPRSGAVRIFGPMREEELPHWEVVWGLLATGDQEIAELNAKLYRTRNEGARKAILEKLIDLRQMQEQIRERSALVILPP